MVPETSNFHRGPAQPSRGDGVGVVPPPHMVAHLSGGVIDGYCVGEPWNARTIADDIGFTSITTQAIWKDHPEKVCAFTEEFAEKNPRTVKAILKALHEASEWLDRLAAWAARSDLPNDETVKAELGKWVPEYRPVARDSGAETGDPKPGAGHLHGAGEAAPGAR